MDNKVAGWVLDTTDFFEPIHPNVITGVGFGLNFLIFYTLKNDLRWTTVVLLILRWFADIMDGNVARRYNKKSAVGNFLDIASDATLIYGIGYIISSKYGYETIFTALCVLYILIFVFRYNGLDENRTEMARENNDTIYSVIVENSLISFIVICAIVLLY